MKYKVQLLTYLVFEILVTPSQDTGGEREGEKPKTKHKLSEYHQIYINIL